ncbi:MAG: penicillin acylase family protein [Nevskia sp.]|nr:penicillin acylase family protein [Nevskia sp.]
MRNTLRAGAMLAFAAGCGLSAPALAAPTYSVTVTRTQYGIPHIKGNDFGSLGYGYGYAFAEDNLCTMMEDYLAIRGQRAQYWGGTGTYSIPAVPVTTNNVDSDFFWKLIADDAHVAAFKAAADPRVEEAVLGYVAGFNRYLDELKNGQHPGRHAACASAPWLQDISESDVYRRFIRLAVIASSSVLETEVATAQPPAPLARRDDFGREMKALARATPQDQPFARINDKKFGSNMYALGPQATDTGVPIVYGNPHFPWKGTERLYMAQMELPGQMNIEGVSLYGVPVILIGFNDTLAWSHTVSTAYRFTFYQLPLNPFKPTQYFYAGKLTNMTAVPLSVQVLQSDGTTLKTAKRTLYKTQYGPMLNITVSGIPVLGWTTATGFTMRDANLENTRLINQFFQWNLAQSLDQFKQEHASILGVPWVNTVASGPGGDAYYGDLSVVPNTPDAMVKSCTPPITGALVAQLSPGLPILYGNRADCQWKTDSDAPAPGIFGANNLPRIDRQDWVANMNDSYWLTNPAQPLDGYARIIGTEGTARTLRTRLGIRQVQQRLDGSDGLGGTKFNLQNLQQIALSARVYSGELAAPQVLKNLCPKAGTYNFTVACNSLAQWDKTASLDSIGLPLWQEFWNRVSAIKGNYWKVPFSLSDPVNTPNTLDTSNPAVRSALAKAQTAVESAGSAFFNNPLGEIQHSGVNVDANGNKIPIFGGINDPEGIFTTAAADSLTQDGYDIDFGNSYIQTVTWDGGGVHAEGFLTYSESTDPASPHYSDFTQAYSAKQWYRFPFHDAEIAAAQESQIVLTSP